MNLHFCDLCHKLKEPGARVCPYCGYDEVADRPRLDQERKDEKFRLILILEGLIILPVHWFMILMTVPAVIAIVQEGKVVRLLVETTLFLFFSGSEKLGDKISCCITLTYVGALVTGWFFVSQLGKEDTPVKLRIHCIVGALNIILAVAAGILIFYNIKYL